MRYAYGIVRAGHPSPRRRGVGTPDRPVITVGSGPVAAAVSELAADTPLGEADARTHLDVLIEMLEHGPVLPIRMGTTAESDDDIRRELLDPIAARATTLLDALDDVVELDLDLDLAGGPARVDAAVARLGALCADHVRRGADSDDLVARWAFLVRRADVAGFDDAVAALHRADRRLVMQYVGPLPAAHFIDRVGAAMDGSGEDVDPFVGTGRWGW